MNLSMGFIARVFCLGGVCLRSVAAYKEKILKLANPEVRSRTDRQTNSTTRMHITSFASIGGRMHNKKVSDIAYLPPDTAVW